MRLQLTKNFNLDEFGFEAFGVEPTPHQIRSAWELCRLVGQPIRDYVGSSVVITSGYRTLDHNEKIGGSATSQHLFTVDPDRLVFDAAFDINFARYMDDPEARLDVFEFCRSELSRGFSQCIWYTNTRHFHIGLVGLKQGHCLIKHDSGYLPCPSADSIRHVDERLQ